MNNVIAICGDSGSGKTTLAFKLLSHLEESMVLECDRYHKWERNDYHWKYYTPLHPLANHLELMISDVEQLRVGKEIFQRDYDHALGTFTEGQTIEPEKTIIVSGLHSLCIAADVKIFIDTEKNLKYLWKLERDFKHRGYQIDDIMAKIKSREVEFQNHILPQKKMANIVITYSWCHPAVRRIIETTNTSTPLTRDITNIIGSIN
jgi:phosphoribulokinase